MQNKIKKIKLHIQMRQLISFKNMKKIKIYNYKILSKIKINTIIHNITKKRKIFQKSLKKQIRHHKSYLINYWKKHHILIIKMNVFFRRKNKYNNVIIFQQTQYKYSKMILNKLIQHFANKIINKINRLKKKKVIMFLKTNKIKFKVLINRFNVKISYQM